MAALSFFWYSLKMTGNCEACGEWRELEQCHIKSRGAGGSDDPRNLILMCRREHNMQHSLGWARFIARNPRIEMLLRMKGWTWKLEGTRFLMKLE